ncbi:hypothetical protein [Tenacibaculum maritimum]|uniref:hypothetical protein n=1 Tax=Tenacibaculum maritimum TaxID=107401 RepID=UPI0004276E02|nr:hypothetical protein [Tenacibaculum maritimum]
MKKSFLKTSIIAFSLLTGTFISCKKSIQKSNFSTSSQTTSKSDTLSFPIRKPIVFITNHDKGTSDFYASASTYFKSKKYQIINNTSSLEEIINWINTNTTQNPYGEIHIVALNNPWKGMSLKTVMNGEPITTISLNKHLSKGTLPSIKSGITKDSRIIFHSSDIGSNQSLINLLKSAFTSSETPKIITSPYYSIFGGQFSNYYLAKPYYVFYPTANSPGKTDLSKEIAKKYPTEKEIEWFEALTNEYERYIGEAYTLPCNVPIEWEFDYYNSNHTIPNFHNSKEIIVWIKNNKNLITELERLQIPIKKFRWSYTIKNNKLTIKGKATVLCVLKPLTKPYGDLKYLEPDTNNKCLYTIN